MNFIWTAPLKITWSYRKNKNVCAQAPEQKLSQAIYEQLNWAPPPPPNHEDDYQSRLQDFINKEMRVLDSISISETNP